MFSGSQEKPKQKCLIFSLQPLDHKKDCKRKTERNKKIPPKYKFFGDFTEKNSPSEKRSASAELKPRKKVKKFMNSYHSNTCSKKVKLYNLLHQTSEILLRQTSS